jgi:glutathione peroxidase
MNKLQIFISALTAITSLACTRVKSIPENMKTEQKDTGFYQISMRSIDGESINFSRYKGKKVLIVNVASECGFTPQYAELETLHKKFGDKLVVLGFPCNQFGGQEPGSAEDIRTFCSKNYGVSFQLFEKTDVKGEKQSAVYQWLGSKALNGWNDELPNWNFCKYLIDENGRLLRFFPSRIKPMSEEITGLL